MIGYPKKAEQAQVMVEFALGAIALFALVISIMMFGYAFGKKIDLKGATRGAARRAAVNAESPTAVETAQQAFYDQLALTDDGNATFSITPAPPWDHGDTIIVRSSAAHEINILGIRTWSGTLEAESEIRVE